MGLHGSVRCEQPGPAACAVAQTPPVGPGAARGQGRGASCDSSPRAPSSPAGGMRGDRPSLWDSRLTPWPSMQVGGPRRRTGPHPTPGLISRSSAVAQPVGCALAPQDPLSPERKPLFLQSQGTWGPVVRRTTERPLVLFLLSSWGGGHRPARAGLWAWRGGSGHRGRDDLVRLGVGGRLDGAGPTRRFSHLNRWAA